MLIPAVSPAARHLFLQLTEPHIRIRHGVRLRANAVAIQSVMEEIPIAAPAKRHHHFPPVFAWDLAPTHSEADIPLVEPEWFARIKLQ